MHFFHNETHEYILFMDIEFDQLQLVQFAGLLYRRVKGNCYRLYRSLNTYVKTTVDKKYFTPYTNITNDFLEKWGVRLQDVREQISEELLEGVEGKQLLIVSHGVKGDLHILEENDIHIPYESTFCTFEKAKKILKRKTDVSLEDICCESALYPTNEHNAYMDALFTVEAYDYLKDME